MKLHEYSRSRSFLVLGPVGHSDMKIKKKNVFFSETTEPFVTKFHRKAIRNNEMKINKYEFGRMTNMAAMPVYGKIIYIFKYLLL